MTKEQLIEKLNGVLDDLDTAHDMVADIPDTEIRKIDKVVNGNHDYLAGRYVPEHEKKGACGLISDSLNVIEEIIDELKESI